MCNINDNTWVPRTTPLTAQEVMRLNPDRRAVKDTKARVHVTAADIRARALEIQREHRGPPMTLAEAVTQAQAEIDK